MVNVICQFRPGKDPGHRRWLPNRDAVLLTAAFPTPATHILKAASVAWLGAKDTTVLGLVNFKGNTMAKHDMGPSTVEGFQQQCRKCKALDTEIRFSLGQNCPVDDIAPPPGIPLAEMTQEQLDSLAQAHLGDAPSPEDVMSFMQTLGFRQVNPRQMNIIRMSNWFGGFFNRQFARAAGND